MAKVITRQVMGIDVSMNPDVLEDYDLMHDLRVLMPKEDGEEFSPLDIGKTLDALDRITDMLYGEQFPDIKKKLRTANGGILTTKLMSEFVTETFEVFQKNS